VLSTQYREEFIETEAVLSPRVLGRVREYLKRP
jgi:hypothetical protein